MKILLVDNAHIYKNINNEYFSKGIYDNDFFERYTKIFEEVLFMCKVKTITEENHVQLNKISISNLTFIELPFYRGVNQMISSLPSLKKKIRSLTGKFDAAILRMTQFESILAFHLLALKKKAYLVELVNDPINFTFANCIYKYIYVYNTKQIIKYSKGISYVTREYLQRQYHAKNLPTASYSSISLKHSDIKKPKVYAKEDLEKVIKFIHVSNNITDNSKGFLETLLIMSSLKKHGFNIELTFVGSGEYTHHITQKAKDLDLVSCLIFAGHISDKKILNDLLSSKDIFIFPSHFEGLPRVVIEAMACGLPCITSNVGGLEELVKKENCFRYNDVESFVVRLIEIIQNPDELTKLSYQNTISASEYEEDKLTPIRSAFYKNLYY